MSAGIREAYSELYDRNEYAHEMSKEKLVGLVTEITGASKDDRVTQAIVSSFEALKEFADFDAVEGDEAQDEQVGNNDGSNGRQVPAHTGAGQNTVDDVRFAIGYTINLNLPESTDPEVFNAIFKALKNNLLAR